MCVHVRAGWLNVLGQVAATAGAASTAAAHIASMWLLSNGHVFSQFELFLTYACAPTSAHEHLT